MKLLFESEKSTPIEEEGFKQQEKIYVFQFESLEESEDFSILSHKEKLEELEFKEESTPNKPTKDLHRYAIEDDDDFIIVIETIMTIS